MAMGKRWTLLLLIAVALCTGCPGYSTRTVFRRDIRTIYVEVFDNRTFRRGLEVPLTRAIVAEIKLRTPLAFAPRDEADSILSGELEEFRESSLVKTETDRVLLDRVTAVVRFRWHDRLTQTDIVPPRVVRESARIVEMLEDSLFDRVFEEVAERVVEEMQEPW
jgi:hypothetical protein